MCARLPCLYFIWQHHDTPRTLHLPRTQTRVLAKYWLKTLKTSCFTILGESALRGPRWTSNLTVYEDTRVLGSISKAGCEGCVCGGGCGCVCVFVFFSKVYFTNVNVFMFSYFEPNFIEKFLWKSSFINFRHVTIFAKRKFILWSPFWNGTIFGFFLLI